MAGPGALHIADIGGRASHIETDDSPEAGSRSGSGGTHQPASRPRKNRVLGMERLRGREHPAGLHHLQRHLAAKVSPQLLEIGVQHRSNRRLQHGGVAPGHQPRQGAHLMRQGDLIKPQRRQPGADSLLMARIDHAVQQRHSNAAHAIDPGLLHLLAQRP